MARSPFEYHFGDFRLDPLKRILYEGDEVVQLTPKVFDTLLILVQRHGEVVEKSDLISQLWPDSFVEEGNLTFNVSMLRKALGEQKSDHRYVVTLPGRGYQFVADVEVRERTLPAPAARVEVDVGVPRADVADARENSAVKSEPVRLARRWIPALASLILLLMAGLAAYYLAPRDSPRPFDSFNLRRVTSNGQAWDAAISPDGQQVAFILTDGEQQSLSVKQTATEAAHEVIPFRAMRLRGVTFAPDGKSLYIVVKEPGEAQRALFTIPTAGGTLRKLLTGIDSPVTLSPDGKRLAFISEDPTQGESSLVIAEADGSHRSTLSSRRSPAFFSVDGPAWSPDGKRIAIAAVSGPEVQFRVQVIEVATGVERSLGTKVWDWMMRVAWLPDSRGLLVLARENVPPGNINQLWRITYPSGDADRVTQDLNDYRGLGLTADGRRLVLIATQLVSDVWIIPVNDPHHPVRITNGGTNGRDGIDWVLDDRIVYTARDGGKPDLQIVDITGGRPTPLGVADGVPHHPTVSGDGKYVIFTSGRNGTPHLWRLELATNDLQELTAGQMDNQADSSSDGRWVVYSSERAGVRTLWRVPVAGGQVTPLTDQRAEFPVFSPDGRQVACLYQAGRDQPERVAVIPIEGGAPRILADTPPVNVWPQVAWVPDGKALSYVVTQNGVSNIYRQSLDGGPMVQLTDFTDQRIFAYAWARDGRRIAVARGSQRGDVIMLDETSR